MLCKHHRKLKKKKNHTFTKNKDNKYIFLKNKRDINIVTLNLKKNEYNLFNI